MSTVLLTVPVKVGRAPCLACDVALSLLGCDAALVMLADRVPEAFPLCRSCRGGVVYLLHFARPYKHARHYIGWTRDLAGRLARHEAGSGARLLQVVQDAGIEWRLARLWPGDRRRERALKRQGGAARRCPLCGVRPRSIAGLRSGAHAREAMEVLA
ncbi:hypothetical protein SMC26_30030 [Actinomadura fulvescens]|uniref:GIY-YIG domain-containing protein n=1 Tax=Actinomadura fulvescens TaxID=46160 RepID=A0ABN3PDA6_9ACTN